MKITTIQTFLAGFFLLLASPAPAEQQTLRFHTHHGVDVSIPARSGAVLEPEDNSDRISFRGDMTVSGKVLVYWFTLWQCEPECSAKKTLRMSFFPDKKALAQLPELREGKVVFQPIVITLADSGRAKILDGFAEEKIKALLKNVDNVPDNFFRYRERFVLLPATLRFSGLVAFKECDDYHFTGKFIEIRDTPKALPNQENEASGLPVTCGTPLYDETFSVRAKLADRVEVRTAPDMASDVSFSLENDATVLKIRTVNDDWLYIKAMPEDSPYSPSAKNKAIYGYIHRPSLEISPIN
jgi:hypothetical protein